MDNGDDALLNENKLTEIEEEEFRKLYLKWTSQVFRS